MSLSNVPREIATLFSCLHSRRLDGIERVFAADGVVSDRGDIASGAEALTQWGERYGGEAPGKAYAMTAERMGREYVVGVAHRRAVGGGNFEVDQLDWRFSMGPVGVAKLSISEAPALATGEPTASFIEALNSLDLPRILDAFASDALVNDQFRDYWGLGEIREWAIQDIMEDRLLLRATSTMQHYNNIIMTAIIEGEFDKRGLPEPLMLAFYISSFGGKITQLIILRKQI